MHTEVFNNIDTLVSMADSPLNIDEINTELITLRKSIKNKKSDIEDLKSLMTDSRYFNASNELVDKNIEISLKNKINRLNRKIKDIKISLDETKSSEKKLYNDINDLKEKLNTNESYVKTLEEKAHNSQNNNYYTELLEKEKANVNALTKELTTKKAEYEDILKELELNNLALSELNDKLNTEKSRLKDIEDNLNNPNAYLDEDLKNSDEEKLNALKSDLDSLEKRKLELLTDANVIATDAKELIIENNLIDALNKVKELVTIVKSKPYMDINNKNILDEELEKKESLRLELSTLIDNKNYEDLDNNALSKRINYIKKSTENNKTTIANYEQEINNIDEYVNKEIGPEINDIESTILKLENTLSNYRRLIKEKNKTPKNKANLESAITKKEKEKNILNTILDSYKENLLKSIARTNQIKDIITSLEEENNQYNKELDNLKKLSMLDLKTKDLVEEEEDKEKLKAINEEIKAIKNRQKFDKTPDEIFDQIDMYLASAKEALLKEEPKSEALSIENLFNKDSKETDAKPDIESLSQLETKENPQDKSNERLKVVEIIPISNAGGTK